MESVFSGGRYFVLSVDRAHVQFADVQESESQNVMGVRCFTSLRVPAGTGGKSSVNTGCTKAGFCKNGQWWVFRFSFNSSQKGEWLQVTAVTPNSNVWLIKKHISLLTWTFSNIWKYYCQIAWSLFLFQINSSAGASSKRGSESLKTSLYYFPVKFAIW